MVDLSLLGSRLVINTARACVKRNLNRDTDTAAISTLKTVE
jgi:hypothetical protein